MAYSNISRTRRTVLAFGIQSSSSVQRALSGNTLPYNMAQLPIYENFNPLSMNADIQSIVQAKNTLDPTARRVTNETFGIDGQVYLQGSGIANLHPTWMDLFRVCGFTNTRYTATATAQASGSLSLAAITDGSGGLNTTGARDYDYSWTYLHVASGFESKAATTESITLATTENAVEIDVPANPINAAHRVRVYRSKGGGTTQYLVYDGVGGVTINDLLADDQLTDPKPTETGSVNYSYFTPISEGHEAATVYNFLDAFKWPAGGCRGTINISAQVGQMGVANFTLQGTYNDGVSVANPTIDAPFANLPPRICDINLTLKRETGDLVIFPIVKAFGLNTGTVVSRRDDANTPGCVIEYLITQEYDPHVTFTIEVDNTHDWFKYFKDGEKFAFICTVGDGTGQKIRFMNDSDAGFVDSTTGGDAPEWTGVTKYYASIAAAPRLVDVEGIRCWEIDMLLGGTNNNWLQIKHF